MLKGKQQIFISQFKSQMDDSEKTAISTFLLAVSLVLFEIFLGDLFPNEDFNKISLYFSVICFLWASNHIVSCFLGAYFSKKKGRDRNGGSPSSGCAFDGGGSREDDDGGWKEKPLLPIPEKIKTVFGQKRCEKGHFNTWTIFHFLIFLFAGLYVPGYYLTMFLISVLCEVIELFLGVNSKFILDPCVNMLGYFVGCQLQPIWARKAEQMKCIFFPARKANHMKCSFFPARNFTDEVQLFYCSTHDATTDSDINKG